MHGFVVFVSNNFLYLIGDDDLVPNINICCMLLIYMVQHIKNKIQNHMLIEYEYIDIMQKYIKNII